MQVLGRSSILLRSTKQFADVAQLVEQRIENPCVTGSNPVFGTKFRIATANSKTFTVNETKDAILFNLTRLRIMDNALGYEPGDRSSILLGGSTKTVDNYCKRLYNRNLNKKEVMT